MVTELCGVCKFESGDSAGLGCVQILLLRRNESGRCYVCVFACVRSCLRACVCECARERVDVRWREVTN